MMHWQNMESILSYFCNIKYIYCITNIISIYNLKRNRSELTWWTLRETSIVSQFCPLLGRLLVHVITHFVGVGGFVSVCLLKSVGCLANDPTHYIHTLLAPVEFCTLSLEEHNYCFIIYLSFLLIKFLAHYKFFIWFSWSENERTRTKHSHTHKQEDESEIESVFSPAGMEMGTLFWFVVVVIVVW